MHEMTLKGAREFAGAVSISNNKMPGGTYALATSGCNVGGRLKTVAGSVCHRCYAARLEQFRPAVLAAWTRNLERVTECMETVDGRTAWTRAMIVQIRWAVERTGEPFFRWFDSGDLPEGDMGYNLLGCIADIALCMPDVAFWLPTREARTVADFVGNRMVPLNLRIRRSSAMVAMRPMRVPAPIGTSTVHKAAEPFGHACPTRSQGNQCGACRACWSGSVDNVSYPAH